MTHTAQNPAAKMRPRISKARSTCPACLHRFRKKRPWQVFCQKPCKIAWERLFRRIGSMAAVELSAFYRGLK